MSRVLLFFACVSLAAACGGGSGGAADGGPPDACSGATGCGEPCEEGNEFGVGHYCSEGGGECGDTFAAPYCTVDQVDIDLAFCTRPCDPEGDDTEQCGEGAECRTEGGSGPAGCFPLICE